MRRATAAAALAVAALPALALLGGCAENRGEPPPPLRVVGLRWEQFPDIPFPPGWKPVPGENHVAAAVGGGSVRRLVLAVQAPANRDDILPEKAIAQHAAGTLPEYGWSRPEGRPDALEQRWRKGAEVLVVSASREGGLAVLRYRLEAAP